MTPGGLIASMLLIWRITAPAQSLFLSIGRLRQVDAAKAQMERFFSSPYDGNDATKRMPPSLDMQSIVFERVTFRYASDQEPALAGVSFRLEAGETWSWLARMEPERRRCCGSRLVCSNHKGASSCSASAI